MPFKELGEWIEDVKDLTIGTCKFKPPNTRCPTCTYNTIPQEGICGKPGYKAWKQYARFRRGEQKPEIITWFCKDCYDRNFAYTDF